MNAGRHAKIKALEEAIADEKSVEQVYSCRDQIYDILKVCGFLYSYSSNFSTDCRCKDSTFSLYLYQTKKLG